MTRQSSYMPFLRGRSGASNQKAWRGKAGYAEYLKAQAKLAAGKVGTHIKTKPISSALTGLTVYEAPSIWKMGKNILEHLGAFKEGGRVKGVGKAKRGFGRAMRKK